MKEKHLYICEICGKSSQDKNKILSCENGHAVFDGKEEKEAIYKDGFLFPFRFKVKFSNGYEVLYRLTQSFNKEEKNEPAVLDDNATIIPEYPNGCVFPCWLTIQFRNGMTAEYIDVETKIPSTNVPL